MTLVVVWALCVHSFVVARFRARQGGCHWRGRGRRRWRVTPVGVGSVVPVGVAPAGVVPVGGAVTWHWLWLETQPVATLRAEARRRSIGRSVVGGEQC
jgi:hypothetical protein